MVDRWGLPLKKRGNEGREAKTALGVTVSALRVPVRWPRVLGVTVTASLPVCGSDSVLWDIY